MIASRRIAHLLTATLLVLSGLSSTVIADDPCSALEVRPLLVTPNGRLPPGWPGPQPALVVSWTDYLACPGASPAEQPEGATPLPTTADVTGFATDWETSPGAYAGWANGCVNAAGAAAEESCAILTVPTASPGATLPTTPAVALGPQPEHASGPGHHQLLVLPSQGSNRPQTGCHNVVMTDAMEVLKDTFYVSFDFNCLLDWQNNEGAGDSFDNAIRYSQNHGYDKSNYLVLAWVRSLPDNGYADMATHTAIGAETCPGACVDWREENLAQHEISHLLNGIHPACNVTSIMNACNNPHTGASPHHRHYDRMNLQRICGYTTTCRVV